MPQPEARPAFYAASRGGWRDWWTVLHPPYTAWHLSYVVLGACLAPVIGVSTLLATVLAFFLAVGVGAHALDELSGRPLRTGIPSVQLAAVGGLALAGAVVVGAIGVSRIGVWLVPFIVVGAALVLSYDLELFGGRIHTDSGFAAAWGAFPVLTAYFAQAHTIRVAGVAGAAGAFGLSLAQRHLSTPARLLRRRAVAVEGKVTLAGGEERSLDQKALLAPLERALAALSWSVVAIAAGVAVSRLAG